MDAEEIIKIIIEEAIYIHRKIGPGILENAAWDHSKFQNHIDEKGNPAGIEWL